MKAAYVDDIMSELYFKMQVDAGLRELDEGEGKCYSAVNHFNPSCRLIRSQRVFLIS